MSSTFKSILLTLLAITGVIIPVVVWAQYAYLAEFIWPDSLYEYAQALSLVGFVLLFYQFVLSGRAKLFEASLGLDRLISVHRSLGIWAVGLLLLHGSFITVYELSIGALSTSVAKLIGIVALTILIVAAATAVFWKSFGWSYEQWKKIHYANYIVLPAGLIHALLLGSTVRRSALLRYYLIALTVLYAFVVLVRVVKRAQVRRNPLTVREVVEESHDITSLYLDGDHDEYKPGQFMIVNVENGKGYSEQHPYTISSSPTDGFLRISAKAIGDFSGSLPALKPGSKALVEAPYGVFSYLNVRAGKLVFLAGGIGVTPFLSQLRHMRDTGAERTVRMIWGNKTREDVAFSSELDAAQKELSDFKLVHVLSNEEWDGEQGFIDGGLIRKYIEEPTDWHFMVCGPPVMMNMVFKELKAMGVSKAQIHHERFALG